MIFRRFENLIDIFRDVPDEMPPQTPLRFYAHYVGQAWGVFAALLAVGLAVALIEVALFDFLGRIVDLAQDTTPQRFFAEHGRTLSWMLLVALVLRPLVSSAHDLLVNQAINPGLTSLMRWQHHRYLLRQSLAFFQNDFAGRISNRVMQTASALRESAVQVVDSLWYIIVYIGSAVYLFADADPRLALPLAIWVVCYVGLLRLFLPRMERRAARAAEAASKLSGHIVDSYSNAATLKLFAHTQLEEQSARRTIAEQTNRARALSRVITAMDFSMTVLNGALIVATTGLALWLWTRSMVSVGQIALASGLAIRIVNMSHWILWTLNGIFENVGTVQDGLSSISQPRAVTDAVAAQPLRVHKGGIVFDEVRFHYGREHHVLEGLNLGVRPGEKIGLVGRSGAGKSTLVNLLLRLYDVEGGRILIDGQDIAQVTQESLRSQIGMVSQDTSLLHRSIRENLLYGRPDATEEQLHEALRKARADGFIALLVDEQGRRGLDAQVGERGVKLSGGQRQRIAIARVLLKDAPILVLDEATSALDSEIEAAIQASLDELMRGKTVIAIAHRLSTIARMDRLIIMDRGQIVETGTHAELLERGGLYAQLWQRQVGGFVAA